MDPQDVGGLLISDSYGRMSIIRTTSLIPSTPSCGRILSQPLASHDVGKVEETKSSGTVGLAAAAGLLLLGDEPQVHEVGARHQLCPIGTDPFVDEPFRKKSRSRRSTAKQVG